MSNTIIRIPEEWIPKVLFTSDWHFYHKNIIKYSNRPYADLEEMHKAIIDNTVNELLKLPVSPDGLRFGYLINCGDVVFRRHDSEKIIKEEIEQEIKKRANFGGYFKYCIGNHDINNALLGNPDNFETSYIMEIYRGTKCLLRFYINHGPENHYTGSFNLHGHLHTQSNLKTKLSTEQILELLKENEQKERPNPDYYDTIVYSQSDDHFDVGVDFNNYKPVWLKDILEGKEGINPKVFDNIKFNY